MRIVIIDEKGLMKLPPITSPTSPDTEVVERVKRRYGDDADFLIDLVRLLAIHSDRIKTITVLLTDDREYTLAVE